MRGGIYAIVEALVDALREAGGELRCGVRAYAVELAGGETASLWGGGARGRVTAVRTSAGVLGADAVAFNGDAPSPRERSLSGFALLVGLRGGRDPGRAHHEIRFPADYDAESTTSSSRGGRCAIRRSTSPPRG